MMVFGDAVKQETYDLIAELNKINIELWMVSGDSEKTTAAVARKLGMTRFAGGALPEKKVEIIKSIQAGGKTVGMVGDGINDAAALAASHVGMSIGAGDNLMREVSDITFTGKNPAVLKEAIRLSSKTGRIIRQNLVFAFAYNSIGVPLAVMGLLHPFMAVVAMFFSSLTVIGNTLRITRFNRNPGR